MSSLYAIRVNGDCFRVYKYTERSQESHDYYGVDKYYTIGSFDYVKHPNGFYEYGRRTTYNKPTKIELEYDIIQIIEVKEE